MWIFHFRMLSFESILWSMKDKQYLIQKSSGEQSVFSHEQLKKSLLNSGATEEIAEEIIKQVEQDLYEGYPSNKIYRLAFKLLKKHSRATAAKYKLKQGILELGPTGFVFEKYVSIVIQSQGYATTVGEYVEGKCVRHEIDIYAKSKEKTLMVECKFHNLPTLKCDVKVPLYINSRYKDILDKNPIPNFEGWIITNTRYTDDAYTYGTCAGLKLISWDQPKKGSLKHIIDISRLYPITCLTTLTKQEKDILLSKDIILCMQLLETDELNRLVSSQGRLKNIYKELDSLCH